MARLLDLFCCEGGAAVGYLRAGFDEVVGVDVVDKSARYPGQFVQGDAIAFLREHGREFDAVHASPPCQHASAGTRARDRSQYPALIGPTREALAEVGRPWVIENVAGAALRDPTWLCGCQFGLVATDDDGVELHLRRRRGFESSFILPAPRPCNHPRGVQVAGSYGGARRDKVEARTVRRGGYVPSARVQAALLGIDWMTEAGMHQSIPPAYTEWVGRFFLDAVGVSA